MAQAKLELLLELKNRLKAGLATAKSNALTQLKSMKSSLNEFSNHNMKAFSGIMDQIPGVGRAVGLLANPYALAAAAALAFGVAAAKAANMSLDWQSNMAKVNVTAGLGKTELKNLSNQLRYIGAHGTTDIMTIPDAFNRIISAGLSVDDSLKALGPTLKATKAGFSDIDTVAASGISVMKSSGEDIKVVYDTLFATLNKGNAEFSAIAKYLPSIIPGAKLAGSTLQETAGAYAFLTGSLSPEVSATGLKNIFKSLSDPRMFEAFEKIGVDVFDAKGKFRGIVPVVEDLKGSMNGLSDQQRSYKFGLVGLDQEAKMAFGNMIQHSDELKTTIDAVTNSTGQLDEAVKNSKVSTDGWAAGWNKVKFLALEFGDLFLPIIDKIGEGFDYIMEANMNFFIHSKAFFSGLISGAKETLKILAPIGEAFMNIGNPIAFAQSLSKIHQAYKNANISAAYNSGVKEVLDSYISNPADLVPKAKVKIGDGENEVKDGKVITDNNPAGQQGKSIVFNIGTLYKGENKITQGGEGMSLTEFERKMTEVILRTIRNVEASY